jgi:hypothetical protein
MGASVIVAGYDQNLSRYTDTEESRDASIGIPQVYYAENVLPTKEGIASVAWLESSGDSALPAGRFPVSLYMSNGSKVPLYLAVEEESVTEFVAYFVTRPTSGVSERPVTGSTETSDTGILGSVLTHAYVQGHNYVYSPQYGLFVFTDDPYDPRHTPVVFNGLDTTQITGIVASNGYLLAYTKDSIAWSSTLQLMPDRVQPSTAYGVGELARHPSASNTVGVRYNCTVAGTTSATPPTYSTTVGESVVDGTATFVCEVLDIDFEPSLETGAGGGILEDVRGDVVTCMPTMSGFIVYTTQNIVVASYTSSAEYPYNFRALPNSAGIRHSACVTDAAEVGWQYALTTAGILQVSATGCRPIMPSIQAWLGSLEDWVLLSTGFHRQPAVYEYYRLAFVGSRYLCISKGISELLNSMTVVYDTLLDRYGQLRIPHVFVMDRQSPFSGADVNQGLPIVLQPSGTIYMWKAQEGYTDAQRVRPLGVESKVVLGRYRHSRGNHIELHEVAASNLMEETSQVQAFSTSSDGTSTASGPMLYLHARTEVLARHKYYSRVQGADVSLLITGRFELNSLELTFTTGGHR